MLNIYSKNGTLSCYCLEIFNVPQIIRFIATWLTWPHTTKYIIQLKIATKQDKGFFRAIFLDLFLIIFVRAFLNVDFI